MVAQVKVWDINGAFHKFTFHKVDYPAVHCEHYYKSWRTLDGLRLKNFLFDQVSWATASVDIWESMTKWIDKTTYIW